MHLAALTQDYFKGIFFRENVNIGWQAVRVHLRGF